MGAGETTLLFPQVDGKRGGGQACQGWKDEKNDRTAVREGVRTRWEGECVR